MSKEHIFGLWLKELFPRDANTTHISARISWPKKLISSAPIDRREHGQGHSGSKKLRVVCKKCNTSWMSKLEAWAKTALPPMIIGRRCNLVPSGQMGLATWAAKTAMVAEYFEPRGDSITQEERTWLMGNRKPPAGWFVWIGSYRGTDWGNLTIFQSRAALSPTPVRSPDVAPYYIQATTFGLGHTLFCVLSSSLPDIGNNFAGVEPFGLVQIWPPQPRSILWPAVTILGDSDAYNVANLISKSRAFDQSLDPAADWTFAGF